MRSTQNPVLGPAPTHARGSRRRGASAAVASAALVAGAVAGGALATSPAHAAAPIQLQYKAGDTGSDMIEPWFTLTNTGSSPLALSSVSIRYYFTIDNASSYVFACEWAQIGCGTMNGSIGTLANPTPTADHYIELDFTGGILAPGASTGDIQVRANAAGWAPVNQRNDYSFIASQTSYGTTDTTTVSINGAIVFGTAPGGNPTTPPSSSGSSSPSSSPSSTPSSSGSSTPPPNGHVLFDDFSYTGPADPNLGAHGWAIRTGSGGPGVQNTWSAQAFSFPSDPTAQGGHVMDLTATTDGTTAGTTQAEIDTTRQKFFEGTYAARVYFNDKPTGTNGDHVNETFYTITPDNSLYSEDDFEYLPNGGWGGPANSMYTTTWYSADAMDRVTNDTIGSLQGWHTLVATVWGGTVTYYIDGKQVFSSAGKYYPRQPMTIDFNEWFIDLPFTGARSWDEKVNWVYFNSGGAMAPSAVQSAVDSYYGSGTHFADTVPNS